MTAITYLTAREMESKTGFKHALGYSLPEEDKILLRKGLPKKKKKEVLAHEEEHIINGEEGPFLGALIGGAIGLFGASKAAKAQKSAAATAAAGSEREIEFARESRDIARADVAPYREAGQTALQALMSMTGLAAPAGGARGAPTARQALPPGRGTFQDRGDIPIRAGASRRSAYQLRYNGGPIDNEQMYNVNELGPENVYSGGAVTRNPNPATINGKTGYVEPNIEGRAFGGVMEPRRMVPPTIDPAGYGGPPAPIPGAVTPTAAPPAPAVNPGIAAGGVMENPGGVEGGYSFMTDPGYEFRRGEGQRAIERSAAARGGLLSGGTGRALTRYGQEYASNEYQNVFERIGRIAGLGAGAAGQAGGYAMSAGQGMGRAASEGAGATAYGQIGASSAWATGANQLAQLPWGDVFNRRTPSTVTGYGDEIGGAGSVMGGVYTPYRG